VADRQVRVGAIPWRFESSPWHHYKIRRFFQSQKESRTREARPTDFRPQDYKFLKAGVEKLQKINKKFLNFNSLK
jgi:hypothetical protein